MSATIFPNNRKPITSKGGDSNEVLKDKTLFIRRTAGRANDTPRNLKNQSNEKANHQFTKRIRLDAVTFQRCEASNKTASIKNNKKKLQDRRTKATRCPITTSNTQLEKSFALGKQQKQTNEIKKAPRRYQRTGRTTINQSIKLCHKFNYTTSYKIKTP